MSFSKEGHIVMRHLLPVIFRATWKDQKIIKGTLGDIAYKTKEARITKTAVVIVGEALLPRKYEFSKVYDPGFTHGFRKATN